VEFALLAPLFVALILWSNYFYEVLYARVKTAEMARFIGFERTVRSNVPAIVSEARNRYQDLDGTTKGLALPPSYRNLLTVNATSSNAAAPLSGDTGQTASDAGGGISGAFAKVSSVIGSSVEKLIGLLGFSTSQGAVKADVTFSLQNRVVPSRIASLVVSPGNSLNLTLKDSFFMYHDTWRAWEPGDNPKNTYPTVQQRTQARVRKVAYLGLNDLAGGALDAVGQVLSVLGLEWPLSSDYINDSVLIRRVPDTARYSDAFGSRTVPGDKLLAPVWMSETKMKAPWTVNAELRQKTGQQSTGGEEDNWPMRAYNCRGDYFQGARKSELPEVFFPLMDSGTAHAYFKFSANACRD
jgi:hypothetical protein